MQHQELNFIEVFKCIDNDCKFVSGSKYPEYQDKRELIIPMLFTDLAKMDHGREYYIQKYIFSYLTCSSPSSITKFEIVNDYIFENNLYPGISFERKFKYLNISPIISDLNSPFTNVFKTTVIEMNVLSPVICGQFFENMVSLACNLDITQDLNPSPVICEQPGDIEYLLNSLKINGDYKTIHHKNLGMCLLTQLVHAIDLTNYFHEFIYVRNLLNTDYVERLNYYLEELKKTIIGRFKCPTKSVKVYQSPTVSNEYISGESDLLTDDAVIDIKCYKSEPVKLWKYQLEIYNNMIERPRKKLMIINLLSNKVFTWNIDFDTVYQNKIVEPESSQLDPDPEQAPVQLLIEEESEEW